MLNSDFTQEEKDYWCSVAGHVWQRSIMEEPADFCYCCGMPSNRKEVRRYLTENEYSDRVHSTSQDKPEQQTP